MGRASVRTPDEVERRRLIAHLMGAVGLALGWVGYTLAYFGFCSIRGPGVGLLDLIVPGRDVTIPQQGDLGAGVPTGPGGAGQPSGSTGTPQGPKGP